jgi:hypothetical protein
MVQTGRNLRLCVRPDRKLSRRVQSRVRAALSPVPLPLPRPPPLPLPLPPRKRTTEVLWCAAERLYRLVGLLLSTDRSLLSVFGYQTTDVQDTVCYVNWLNMVWRSALCSAVLCCAVLTGADRR